MASRQMLCTRPRRSNDRRCGDNRRDNWLSDSAGGEASRTEGWFKSRESATAQLQIMHFNCKHISGKFVVCNCNWRRRRSLPPIARPSKFQRHKAKAISHPPSPGPSRPRDKQYSFASLNISFIKVSLPICKTERTVSEILWSFSTL